MRHLFFVAALAACGSSFDHLPDAPEHRHREDGFFHARPEDDMLPFYCLANGQQVPCPTGARPPADQLSCDAAGCHGNYDYQAETPVQDRHLHGGDGPSCFTCHDNEWENKRDVVTAP